MTPETPFRALLGAMISGLLAFSSPVWAQTPVPKVTGVQFGVHEDRVRLRLDVAPAPAFALFTLSDPDRLVIDFPALDWSVPEQAAVQIPYVGAIRFGLFRRDRARVVMDLTQPVSVERALPSPRADQSPENWS